MRNPAPSLIGEEERIPFLCNSATLDVSLKVSCEARSAIVARARYAADRRQGLLPQGNLHNCRGGFIKRYTTAQLRVSKDIERAPQGAASRWPPTSLRGQPWQFAAQLAGLVAALPDVHHPAAELAAPITFCFSCTTYKDPRPSSQHRSRRQGRR
jgi:hypothetical protein